MFLFLGTISLTAVNALNSKIDSLERTLSNHSRMDVTKVDILNGLAYESYIDDAIKAQTYGDQALELATKLNYQKGEASSLWIIGLSTLKSDKKIALDYFQKALVLGEKAGDKPGVSNYLMSIGNVNIELGDTKKADEFLRKALQVAEETKDKGLIVTTSYYYIRNQAREGNYLKTIKDLQKIISMASEIGDKKMLAKLYNQLAVIYARQGRHPIALEYYLSALKINKQLDNRSDLFYNLINISSIQAEQKDYDAAIKTVQEAYKLSKEAGDSLQISICYFNMGNFHVTRNSQVALTYFQKAKEAIKDNNINQSIIILKQTGKIYTNRGEYAKALKNFEEALALAQKINLKRVYGEVWHKMGVLYFVQKQYEQALGNTQKALNLAEELGLLDLQKDCHQLLADIYAATNSFDKAYFNHVRFKLLSDSIFGEKNIRQLTFLESSYEYDKERQKHELEKMNQKLKIESQKQIILLLVVTSFLIVLLSFALYRSNKFKKRLLKLQIENMNRELEHSQKEIASATLKLIQNSESDAHCVKMLEEIKNNATGEGENSIRSLISYYKNKSVYSNWEEFETLFIKVNGSFFDKLNELFPTLTPNERKLCVFLKLHMNSKDIAQITFQSEEALKKARLRLRKKLELDREANLAAFIQSL